MTSNGLLKSALLNGVQLTKAQVEKCMAAEQIPFPQHRPRGRLLKADLVDALLSNVLDGESEETIAQVRKRLCRETQPDAEEDDDDELCPEEILRLIRNMDQDNREHFKEVQKEAGRLLERRSRKETAGKGNAERNRAAEEPRPADGRARDPRPGEPEPRQEAEEPRHDEAPAPRQEGQEPHRDEEPEPRPDRPAAEDAQREADLPSQPHVGSHASRRSTARALTPEALRDLLPPLDDGLYLKWRPKNRQVGVEFKSRCIQRVAFITSVFKV